MDPMEAIRRKWASEGPDREFSSVTNSGELVYLAHYPEGIVIRLNGQEEQIAYLTPGAAARLARVLFVSGKLITEEELKRWLAVGAFS